MDAMLDTSKFHVGWGTHLLSGAMTAAPRFWRLMGKLESMVLDEQLEEIQVSQPVYVTGLARSGTTIMLEVLASHDDVVTHRYSDFPGLFTPYWWGKSSEHSPAKLEERAHGDGLMVSQHSPEAMEEVLWMAHFDHLHDVDRCCVLDANCGNQAFEREYLEHIRKLLLLRSGTRYVAKGNYNMSRLGYIQKILPDAKFIIPIRHPVTHIASLMKQHKLFCRGQQEHPRALDHLRRVGHFEFGLDRRPINLGDQDLVNEIIHNWQEGAAVIGWARYWTMLYGWLEQQLATNPFLSARTKIVRFEDLCSDPHSTLQSVLQFCNLEDPVLIAGWEQKISLPNYYRPDVSDAQFDQIQQHCGGIAEVFGYDASSWDEMVTRSE